jgi:hypothetical protein
MELLILFQMVKRMETLFLKELLTMVTVMA